MKTRGIVLGLMVACVAGTVMAQENDDMYFNKKDRAKLNAQKAQATALAYSNKNGSDDLDFNDDVFAATASYSTRNTNPEYISRSNSEVAQSDNEDYFIVSESYANAQNLSRFNDNYNNWYNNPWYSNSYYAPSRYAWNSPFYGGFNSPWGYGYGSGMYVSVGYGWGSPYYGGYWGSGYSPWDYGYGYPYGGYYGNSWGYYNGWGYYGGNNYWGNNVIIINDGAGRNVAYNKRPSRGGMIANENAGNRTRSQIISRGDGNSNGRVATPTSGRTQQTAGRQDEYYNRSWRRASEAPATRTTNQWNSSTPTRTTSPSNTRSTNWNSGNNTYQPSRSSGSYNPGSSGGSRSGGSSSGASSSGGSGGRTRSH